MIENNPTNVYAAFDILREQIQSEIELCNKAVTKALTDDNYEQAREALDCGSRYKAYLSKVDALRAEWQALSPSDAAKHSPHVAQAHNRNENLSSLETIGRSRPTNRLYLSQESYFRPILAAISENGGQATAATVISRVEQLMADLLTDSDRHPLDSNPDMQRWRAIVHAARHTMVRDGFLKPDTNRGVWAITEKGRRWLALPLAAMHQSDRQYRAATINTPAAHRPKRRNLGRVLRGDKTPQEAFFRPILETLVSFGGKGRLNNVLSEVERTMQSVFKTEDLKPLPSNPEQPRWRNTAQWARHDMVKQGLLRSDSSAGIWEISDTGREYLTQHQP